MSSTKTTFILSELIFSVTSSASIKEILDLYEKSFIADNQFSIPVIFPILEIRMKNVIQNYLELKQHLRTATKLLNNLMKKVEELFGLLTSIYGLVRNEDMNGKMHELVKEAAINFEQSCKDMRSVLFTMIDHETKILNLNPTLYADLHEIIKDTIEQNLYEDNYVKEQLNIMNDQLLAYQKTISGLELRSKTSVVLQTVFEFRKAVNSILWIVNKRKATNELVPEILINMVNQLNEKFEAILEGFKAFINSIYVSEAKEQDIVETITVYQLILNKVLYTK